jgi:hypothetical protein
MKLEIGSTALSVIVFGVTGYDFMKAHLQI